MQLKTNRTMLSLFICALFLVCSTVPAYSSTVTLLSKEYTKPTGKPVTYTDTFTVPQGVTTCNIVLKNEEAKQGGQIYSVSINGVEIFNSKELKNVGTAEQVVVFQTENTLEVSLKGQGGHSIELEIVGEISRDQDAPAPPRR